MLDLPSARNQRRVAIMGGTFDPIHFGHLAVAEEVRERFGIQTVIFIPSGQPPHKKSYAVSPAEDRYRMTALAVNSNPHFVASRIEVDRPGLTFTVDTLRELREWFGPQTEIYFITGADAVLEILSWREPEAILRESRLVAVHRPGYDLGHLAETLGPERAARVELLATRELDISSTELRERVALGRSIRYLTPAPVIAYIERCRLYR